MQLGTGCLQMRMLKLQLLIFLFNPVQCDGMPGQGGALFISAPAAGVLLQNSAVPRRPVIDMLGIAQLGGAQALAVGGTDAGYVHKGGVVTELAPEVPVFHDGKLLIEVRVDSTHRADSEQYRMDGQVVDAP